MIPGELYRAISCCPVWDRPDIWHTVGNLSPDVDHVEAGQTVCCLESPVHNGTDWRVRICCAETGLTGWTRWGDTWAYNSWCKHEDKEGRKP